MLTLPLSTSWPSGRGLLAPPPPSLPGLRKGFWALVRSGFPPLPLPAPALHTCRFSPQIPSPSQNPEREAFSWTRQ